MGIGTSLLLHRSVTARTFSNREIPVDVLTGLKTWDAVNPEMVHPGDTFTIDIWVTDVPPPDLTAGIISSGFLMTYNPTQVSIVSVDAYDNVDIAGGPWDGSSTLKGPDVIRTGFIFACISAVKLCYPGCRRGRDSCLR